MDTAAVEDHVVSVLGDLFPPGVLEATRADALGVGHDIVLQTPDQTFRIDIEYRSLIDEAYAISLERRSASKAGLRLFVADRIVERARRELTSSGMSWLDLRGHLHLESRGLLVDTGVAPYAEAGPREGPRSSRVAVATAVDLLLEPERRVGVREVAARIEAAPSSVSTTLRGFAELALVGTDRRPDPGPLFDWLSEAWRPSWYPCELAPDPDSEMRNPALGLGWNDAAAPGWALTGDHAALAMGARFVASHAIPQAFYVPNQRALRLARSALRESPPSVARTFVALAPVMAACSQRMDVATDVDQHWFLTRPLFVALELAQDRGRGVEILKTFDPPGAQRVW